MSLWGSSSGKGVSVRVSSDCVAALTSPNSRKHQGSSKFCRQAGTSISFEAQANVLPTKRPRWGY